jgi:hypothetical protein
VLAAEPPWRPIAPVGRRAGNDQIKTHLRGPGKVLRSRSPDMVRQEIYGYLLAHRAISALICRPATEAGAVRGGEHYPPAARWPEGPVCACCYTAARRTKGTCADCGHAGLVPGINAARQPTCLRCSGLPLNQTCRGCGDETDLAKGQTCWRCLLTSMTRELLAGPGGTIPAGLTTLAAAICSMPRPNSGVTWLRTNPRPGNCCTRWAAEPSS